MISTVCFEGEKSRQRLADVAVSSTQHVSANTYDVSSNNRNNHIFVDNEKKWLKIELDLENQIICEESCRLNDLTVILMLVWRARHNVCI